MRTTLLAILLGGFALTARAQTIAIEPPNLDSWTAVTIIVGGTARSGCVPQIQRPLVNGNDITVRLLAGGEACPAVIVPYVESARIAPLPGGAYHLHVTVVDGGITSEADRDFFVVAGEAPFRVVPNMELSTGRETVEIHSAGEMVFTPSSKVRFGTIPVESLQYVSPSVLRVVTPLHFSSAGSVDVTVDGQTVKRAYVQVNSAAPLDEGLFSTILVPVLYNGRGAGSDWRTDVFVRNDNGVPLTSVNPLAFQPCGDLFCPQQIPANTTLQVIPSPPQAANGFLFHPARGLAPNLHFSARVRPFPGANDFGTELPIVRETSFRRGTIVLTQVPAHNHSRATLRIYALEDPGQFSTGRVSIYAGDQLQQADLLPPLNSSESWRGIVDLGDSAPAAAVKVVAHPFARIWAFVSITDNVDQHVTLVTPNE
jgi:hypothetical protein